MKNNTPTIALTLLLVLAGCSQQTTSTKETKEPATIKPQPSNAEVADIAPQAKPQWDYVQNEALEASQPASSANQQLKKHRLVKISPSIRPRQQPRTNREKYQPQINNAIKLVSEHPVSTFSIDVDTGSYSNLRRMINQGITPPKDAIRIEELINYFDYQYPTPKNVTQPFIVDTEMMTAPWNSDRKLLKIGLKGYELAAKEIGSANLVFLLDVSGSMNSPHKLPLLKRSLNLLTSQLDAGDSVSIVVYAGAAGVVLEPTTGNNQFAINNALNKLSAGGSTHGSQGIELAYQLAQQQMIEGGINRVILATDGDFNVGTTDIKTLKKLIANKRKLGISLTTLGFGQGNYNDHLMEQLADIGNGNYAYIDNINEARKVLVDQLSSTLKTIAKDVKLQVEFNPQQVSEYRLIGYENRQLKREDFNNDKVDAGDIGAGHNVTAIYELTLKSAVHKAIDPLYFQRQQVSNNSTDIALIKLRFKQPQAKQSQLAHFKVNRESIAHPTSRDFKFSVAVAAFGQLLKGGKYLDNYSFQDIIDLASAAKGPDEYGYRSEFIQLVKALSVQQNQVTATTYQGLSTSIH